MHTKDKFLTSEKSLASGVKKSATILQTIAAIAINNTYQQRSLLTFVKERFHNAVGIDILGIFEVYSSLQIWLPQKIFQGRNYSGRIRNDVISIDHVLCSQQESSFTFCLASWCASLSSLTFSSRLVCFLAEFWTVLPCLFMFTNTIAYAFRC